MSNDELNSALQTLGGLMATNLQTKGVSNANASNGLTTLANKILNMELQKLYTSIDIDITSLNLVYGDDFNITGSLTDEDSNVISSATVKLLVGSTIVDTQTTDSNGDVSFTYCPVSMGTHTFKLVYEGDNTYNDCTSSTVNKTVDKETTYLSIQGLDTVTIYSDEAYNVGGSLLDNDSPTPHPVVNKQVNVFLAGNLITYFTTDNNGGFSGNISVSDLNGIGEHALTFSFLGDDNYTASSTQKTVIVQSPSLSLSSNKNVLSYDDTDSATLTATYVAGDKTGKSVVFKAYTTDNISLGNIGSGTTNSNGEVSITYNSRGIGDIVIKAECNGLQSQTSIEDCLKYWAGTYKASLVTNYNLPSEYIIEFTLFSTLVSEGNKKCSCFFRFDSSSGGYVGKGSSTNAKVGVGSLYLPTLISASTDTDYTFSKINGTVYLSDGNDTISLVSSNYNNLYSFAGSSNGHLKNVKVKPIPSISLSASQSVLSYADSETSTLTVTYSCGSGRTVKLYNAENDSLIATMTDNNDETYSYIYESNGIGDISFYAESDGFLSETITIEDCLYYKEPSTTVAVSSLCTNNCVAEYEVYPSDRWNWHYLTIYDDEGNGKTIATLSTSYDNSSSSPIKTTYFPPQNAWTPMQFKIENNVATVSSNGNVKGTANITLSNVNNLRISNSKTTTQQRNIKIKPL